MATLSNSLKHLPMLGLLCLGLLTSTLASADAATAIRLEEASKRQQQESDDRMRESLREPVKQSEFIRVEDGKSNQGNSKQNKAGSAK